MAARRAICELSDTHTFLLGCAFSSWKGKRKRILSLLFLKLGEISLMHRSPGVLLHTRFGEDTLQKLWTLLSVHIVETVAYFENITVELIGQGDNRVSGVEFFMSRVR